MRSWILCSWTSMKWVKLEVLLRTWVLVCSCPLILFPVIRLQITRYTFVQIFVEMVGNGYFSFSVNPSVVPWISCSPEAYCLIFDREDGLWYVLFWRDPLCEKFWGWLTKTQRSVLPAKVFSHLNVYFWFFFFNQ